MPSTRDPDQRDARSEASDDTRALLTLAESLIGSGSIDVSNRHAKFIDQYRDWILRHRGMADDQPVWAERNQILLHLMVSGSTLREAIEIKNRFVNPVWGSDSKMGMIDHGDTLEIFYDEPVGGLDNLISTSWVLSITACQLEFLVGRKLESISVKLKHQPLLPRELAYFFLPRPITYEAHKSAIHIPRSDLDSAVSVTSAQIPSFLENLMRLSVNAQVRDQTSASVANFLWREITRNGSPNATMPAIAAGLGLSASTLRRRLEDEGASFRGVRAEIIDRLAKMWLRETDLPIEQIAERLGYSDAFAFRRAFRRMNGKPPASFRSGENQASR